MTLNSQNDHNENPVNNASRAFMLHDRHPGNHGPFDVEVVYMRFTQVPILIKPHRTQMTGYSYQRESRLRTHQQRLLSLIHISEPTRPY